MECVARSHAALAARQRAAAINMAADSATATKAQVEQLLLLFRTIPLHTLRSIDDYTRVDMAGKIAGIFHDSYIGQALDVAQRLHEGYRYLWRLQLPPQRNARGEPVSVQTSIALQVAREKQQIYCAWALSLALRYLYDHVVDLPVQQFLQAVRPRWFYVAVCTFLCNTNTKKCQDLLLSTYGLTGCDEWFVKACMCSVGFVIPSWQEAVPLACILDSLSLPTVVKLVRESQVFQASTRTSEGEPRPARDDSPRRDTQLKTAKEECLDHGASETEQTDSQQDDDATNRRRRKRARRSEEEDD